MKKVAININTDTWVEIINFLRSDGWVVTAKYYGYDAGIDDDYWCLRKGFKKVEFGWSKLGEGEIKAKESIIKYIEDHLSLKFSFGSPSNLKTLAIATYKLQSLPLWILNRYNFFGKKI